MRTMSHSADRPALSCGGQTSLGGVSGSEEPTELRKVLGREEVAMPVGVHEMVPYYTE